MAKQTEIKEIDSEARLGWQAAEELLQPFGTVPSNFSEAIRALVHQHEKGVAKASLAAENHILRLLRNNTVKATYYYLTKEYRPEVLSAGKLIKEDGLFAAYSPFEHAAILALCFLSRNLSRRTDKDDWTYVEHPLYDALLIGGIVGQAFPEIGLGFGLLSRGLRYLAFAPFLRENRRGFKDYRMFLKGKDLPFCIDYEERTWQTHNIQISGILLERMGFPNGLALEFVAAAYKNKGHTPSELYGIPLSMAEAIIDCYLETGEIPERLPPWVGKEQNISVETRGLLMSKLNKALSAKTRIEWLSKGGSSITPELAPELFQNS